MKASLPSTATSELSTPSSQVSRSGRLALLDTLLYSTATRSIAELWGWRWVVGIGGGRSRREGHDVKRRWMVSQMPVREGPKVPVTLPVQVVSPFVLSLFHAVCVPPSFSYPS